MTPALRDSIFRVLRVAANRDRANVTDEAARERVRVGTLFLLWLAGIPFALALLLVGGWKFLHIDALRIPSFLLLVLAYIGGLTQPLVSVALNWKSIVRGLSDPLGLLLANAKSTTTVDMTYICSLERMPLPALELVLVEVKAEREAFERRIAISAGSIEKLGLFPGLLAAFVAIQQMVSTKAEWWVLSFAYAAPALYLLAAFCQSYVLRLDRIVKVIELAVERAKSKV